MGNVKNIYKQDFYNLITNPAWWFYSIGLPALLMIILGTIASSHFENILSSYDYYAITMMLFGIFSGGTIAANSFMETRLLKANMRLCSMPISTDHIYFSKLIAAWLFNILMHLITFIIFAFITTIALTLYEVLILFIGFIVLEFFTASLGILLCCIFKNEEVVNMLISTGFAILCLLSGCFFPLNGFAKIIGKIADLSFVTWIFKAITYVIYDQNYAPLWWMIGILLIVSCVFVFLCHCLFKREDYL